MPSPRIRGCREIEQSMRGLGSAMRALSEAEVARADFTGLADRVLGACRRAVRASWTALREAWRRPWFPMGGLVAVAAAAFFAFRPAAPVPSPQGVVVQSVTADAPVPVQPVVLKTESGDAIIWLVEHPDASSHRPTVAASPTSRALRRPSPPSRGPARGSCDRAGQRGHRSAWPECWPPRR